MTITSSMTGMYLKIFINNCLHLAVKHDEIQAVRSWRTSNHLFYVEIHTGSAVVQADYDEEGKWLKVLELINEAI